MHYNDESIAIPHILRILRKREHHSCINQRRQCATALNQNQDQAPYQRWR